MALLALCWIATVEHAQVLAFGVQLFRLFLALGNAFIFPDKPVCRPYKLRWHAGGLGIACTENSIQEQSRQGHHVLQMNYRAVMAWCTHANLGLKVGSPLRGK